MKEFGRLGVLVVILAMVGCQREYVRDTDDPTIDEDAMSLRLDRKDLDRLYQENSQALLGSRIAWEWDQKAATGVAPVVAIFPMRNQTSEHIEDALNALLSKFETDLVNGSRVRVVSAENQPDLMAEIRRQMAGGYDPVGLARFGKQLGAQYFVTGKVYDVAERVDDERRAQYFMFVQVLNVETGEIRFQNEAKVTKGLR